MATKILILGGGFAGLATAQALERALKRGEAEVTLVSRDNYSLFTPMLPEVSSGALETRHIITPVRAELRSTNFVLGDVCHIDTESRTVMIVHSISEQTVYYKYDHLVLALGAVTSTFNLPGVAEHTLPLKSLTDAETLRNHVIATLELADVTDDTPTRKRYLSYVVVGGGYTGVETAGELSDLFKSIVRFYPSVDAQDVSITLLEAGKSLLPELPHKMGSYSRQSLSKRGVEVVLEDGVASVDPLGLNLWSGRRIESATIVWSAGAKPTPLVAKLPLPRTKRGAIAVASDFSVPGMQGIWALGDCAAVPTGEAEKYYPATAQHAIREGPVLAKNLVATLRSQPTKAFKYTSLGSMASLGARRGVAQLPGDHVLTGFPAWLMWRGYYLSRLPGTDRKFRVAFDWLAGLLFPRDISELRVFTDRSKNVSSTDAGMVVPKRPPGV